MKRIPLIRDQSQRLLPGLPKPQLDRERRPRVKGAAINQGLAKLGSAQHAVLRPMELATLEAAATTQLGREFARTGNVLFAMGEKAQQAKNDADIADAMLALDKTAAEFEEWKLKNQGNPSAWAKEWEGRSSAAINAALSNESLSPLAKDAIRKNAAHWSGQRAIAVSASAAKAEFSRAKNSTLALVDKAIFTGDEAMLETAIAVGKQRGYLWDHEEVGYREQFKRAGEARQKKAEAALLEADQQRLHAIMMDDPKQALAMLEGTRADGGSDEFLSFDAVKVRSARRMVMEQMDRNDAANRNHALEMIAADQLDDKGIDRMVSEGRISASDGVEFKRYRNRLDRQKLFVAPKIDQRELRRLVDVINEYAEQRDKDTDMKLYSRIYQDLMTTAIGGGIAGERVQGALSARLSALRPHRVVPKGDERLDNFSQELAEQFRNYMKAGDIPGYDPEDKFVDPDVVGLEFDLQRDLERILGDPEATKKFFEKGERGAVKRWLNTQLAPLRMGKNAGRKKQLSVEQEEELRRLVK